MHNEVPLARCMAGRRIANETNLLMSPCSSVTTAALQEGDRLQLQDIDNSELTDTGRYVLVAATPAETAASNFWGVIKLADID